MSKVLPALVSPWAADGDLGDAYNEWLGMFAGRFEWVVFADHDGEVLNRDWHARLEAGIAELERRVSSEAGLLPPGIVTIAVNRLKTFNDEHDGMGQSCGILGDHNTADRVAIAGELERRWGNEAFAIGAETPTLMAGYFMCVNVERALEVGGFAEGFAGVDNEMHRRLEQYGYGVYLMPGLLFWHRHREFEPRGDRSNLPQFSRP